MTTKTKVPNRLAQEKSPYLLQHQYNPVDWHPWGEEAFSKAKAEDKPIFLSIGYSTCHWCHVMERESFEDDEVAEVLNKGYISVKVDREERPDIDHLYMTFCQAMTGQGGWPLTIIMTPEKKPFFAGTYFPRQSRTGMPGLINILAKIREIWDTERSILVDSGEEATESILKKSLTFQSGELKPELLDNAYETYRSNYDSLYGGIGDAPKFPAPHNLGFLLRYGRVRGSMDNGKGNNRNNAGIEREALQMVEITLEQMYKGGIFDHIGFGFSRYSTDRKWLAPHFEKMLYDNALLAITYLETYQAAKKPLYQEVAEKIFTYVLRDMTSPEGGFYSAEDADSEGEEGRFYLWTPREVLDILGEEKGRLFCQVYDISAQGNFEGKSIPNLIGRSLDDPLLNDNRALLEQCRDALFTAREKRVHPYKDDKILTAWNGLMIAALALGARVLDNSAYLSAAEKALSFIFKRLRRSDDGRLLARYRDGEAAYPAYLDDYAFLIWALIELYQTIYRPDYLGKALELNAQMLDLFWDRENGGFFLVGKDGEELLARTKEIYDGAIPSGNSAACMNLLRLAALTGDFSLREKAQDLFRACGGSVWDNPAGYGFLLQAYLYSVAPSREIIIAEGSDPEEADQMVKALRQEFLPHTVSVRLFPGGEDIVKTAPYLKDYHPVDNRASAYICENKACQTPLTGVEAFRQALC